MINLKVVASKYNHQPYYQQHGEHAAEASHQEGRGCRLSQHQAGPVRDRNSPSRRRRRARREATRLASVSKERKISDDAFIEEKEDNEDL